MVDSICRSLENTVTISVTFMQMVENGFVYRHYRNRFSV